LSQRRLDTVQAFYKAKIDFRELINFKNVLFDSDQRTDENLLPITEFERLRSISEHVSIRKNLG
jgi:hypothetical protein